MSFRRALQNWQGLLVKISIYRPTVSLEANQEGAFSVLLPPEFFLKGFPNTAKTLNWQSVLWKHDTKVKCSLVGGNCTRKRKKTPPCSMHFTYSSSKFGEGSMMLFPHPKEHQDILNPWRPLSWKHFAAIYRLYQIGPSLTSSVLKTCCMLIKYTVTA